MTNFELPEISPDAVLFREEELCALSSGCRHRPDLVQGPDALIGAPVLAIALDRIFGSSLNAIRLAEAERIALSHLIDEEMERIKYTPLDEKREACTHSAGEHLAFLGMLKKKTSPTIN